MDKEQLETRTLKAHKGMVMTRVQGGYQVHSKQHPSRVYNVTVVDDRIVCTCPDFELNKDDPSWQCKHIIAAIADFEQQNLTGSADAPNGNGNNRAALKAPVQIEAKEADVLEKAATVPAARSSASTQPHMLIKRSISPDGRIDCISVNIDFSLADDSITEIKAKAARALKLQTDIVKEFLASVEPPERPVQVPLTQLPPVPTPVPTAHPQPVTPLPAVMRDIGMMNGKWGARHFINVEVEGKAIKLFGSQKQLSEHIQSAGYSFPAERIVEGTKLNIPCRVVTQPSSDGRYLNVERVFPAAYIATGT